MSMLMHLQLHAAYRGKTSDGEREGRETGVALWLSYPFFIYRIHEHTAAHQRSSYSSQWGGMG